MNITDKTREINLLAAEMNVIAQAIKGKQGLYREYSCCMKEEITGNYDLNVLNHYQESMKYCDVAIKGLNNNWSVKFDYLKKLRAELKAMINDIEVKE